MKVGSLVECVDGVFNPHPSCVHLLQRLPVTHEILTVRAINECPLYGGLGLLFEEIVNGINPNTGNELSFKIEQFRELQPPMDLTELLEETITELA